MVSLARPSWKQRGRDEHGRVRMLTPEQAVLASILICIGGAVLVLAVSHHKLVAGWFTFLVTATTAVLICFAVVQVLFSGPSAHPAAFWALPAIGFALRIHVDGLTAVFLLLGCHHRGASVVLLHSLYAALPGIRSRPLLPVFFAVPGRDVWIAQYHRHDVVLLHLLADDDFAGICAHLLRKQEGQEISAPPTNIYS